MAYKKNHTVDEAHCVSPDFETLEEANKFLENLIEYLNRV